VSGNLFVIAAPSGTGKTTLVKSLTETVEGICVSISHTTRERRNQEIDGIHYYFVSRTEFEKRIQHGDFLEYATIFHQYYGTSKTAVAETLAKGTDVILEIDWQGHQQIKKLFPHAIGIFILPPSLADLRARLETRNQDHPDILRERLSNAKEAVAHIKEFDYIVVNDEFSHALQELKTIVAACRLLQVPQHLKYQKLINDLSEF
jgi:guanylate kinase